MREQQTMDKEKLERIKEEKLKELEENQIPSKFKADLTKKKII